MPEPEEISLDPTFEERVRCRAHELYLARGGEHGADVDDWVRAEEELRLEAEDAGAARVSTPAKAMGAG